MFFKEVLIFPRVDTHIHVYTNVYGSYKWTKPTLTGWRRENPKAGRKHQRSMAT